MYAWQQYQFPTDKPPRELLAGTILTIIGAALLVTSLYGLIFGVLALVFGVLANVMRKRAFGIVVWTMGLVGLLIGIVALPFSISGWHTSPYQLFLPLTAVTGGIATVIGGLVIYAALPPSYLYHRLPSYYPVRYYPMPFYRVEQTAVYFEEIPPPQPPPPPAL